MAHSHEHSHEDGTTETVFIETAVIEYFDPVYNTNTNM